MLGQTRQIAVDMERNIRPKRLLSAFTISLLFFLEVTLGNVHPSLPSPLYVRFKSVLAHESDVFLLDLVNGSEIPLKDLTVTFSMTEIGTDTVRSQLSINSSDFKREVSVNGNIADDRLLIDSTPSIFVVDPDLLNEDREILLTEVLNWTLIGLVEKIRNLPTAIEGQEIEAVEVEAFHFKDQGKSMPLLLGYDPSTGIVVRLAGVVSDVLLKEMGIEQIWGGELRLVDFSNNLKFKLVNSPHGSGWALIIIPLLLFTILTVGIFVTLRKRKLRHRTIK